MDGGRAGDWKRSLIDRHEVGEGGEEATRRNGSQRLEGHLVEMGLGKNKISGEGYISSLTASRNGSNDKVSESSAQAQALLCR